MGNKNKNKKGLFDKAETDDKPIPFSMTDDGERRIADLERKVELLLAVVAGTLEPLQGWHPQDEIKELKKIAGVK